MSTSSKIYSIVLGILIVVFAALAGYFYLHTNKLQPIDVNLLKNPILNQSNSKNVLGQQIGAAYNTNNFAQANQLADQQLAGDPNGVEALLQKANVLAQQASLTYKEKELGDEAKTYVQKVLDIDPKNLEALSLMGYIFEIQQDYVNANKYYDAALSINPNFAKALDHKGHTYDLQGDLKSAQTYYLKAVTADPTFAKTYSHLGRVYLLQGDNKDAETNFQKVLSISDNVRDKAEAYYSLGNIYETKSFSQKSFDNYQKAISTDPTLDIAYVGLAKEQFLNKQVNDSFQNLAKAAQMNPKLSAAGFQLGLEFYAMGNSENAKTVLAKTAQMIPDDITLNAASKKIMSAAVTELLKMIK